MEHVASAPTQEPPLPLQPPHDLQLPRVQQSMASLFQIRKTRLPATLPQCPPPPPAAVAPPSPPTASYDEAVKSGDWKTYGLSLSGDYSSIPESVDRLMYRLHTEGHISAETRMQRGTMKQLVAAMASGGDTRTSKILQTVLSRAVSKCVRGREKMTGGRSSKDSTERARKKEAKLGLGELRDLASDNSDSSGDRSPSQGF